jgi:hypothetical protein
VGTDKDGVPVSYDRNTGNFARSDGKPVQDTTLFRKVTGAAATKEISASDVNSFLKDQAGQVVIIDPDTKKPVRLSDLPLEEQNQIARTILGGAPAGPASGGLPDVDPGKMRLPGQGAAPQAALPLANRLSTAVNADSQRTDKMNFQQLADEVARTAPAMQARFNTLQTSIPNVANPQTRAILQAEADKLEEELQLVPGILQQRSALFGN